MSEKLQRHCFAFALFPPQLLLTSAQQPVLSVFTDDYCLAFALKAENSVIIQLTGSSTHSRNEEIMPHFLFLNVFPIAFGNKPKDQTMERKKNVNLPHIPQMDEHISRVCGSVGFGDCFCAEMVLCLLTAECLTPSWGRCCPALLCSAVLSHSNTFESWRADFWLAANASWRSTTVNNLLPA